MPRSRLVLVTGLLTALLPHPAQAESPRPVVVELFTSQSCSSCPPAEAFLGSLARRPDIIALEWHVTYWNELVHGTAGRWADPYSDPAFTRRQRTYAASLETTRGIYTPQMVVQGQHEAVGSDQRRVNALIDAATQTTPETEITIAPAPDGLSITVSSAPPGSTLWLATFHNRQQTDVKGGENKGLRLDNHHIVTAFSALDVVSGHGKASTTIPVPAAGMGCAALVQFSTENPARLGAVESAAICP